MPVSTQTPGVVSWPGTLPQRPLRRGYRYTPGDGGVRFQPEVGPPIVWLRALEAPNAIQANYLCAGQSVRDAMQTFWEDTTKFGTLPFDGPHPESGLTATFQILDLQFSAIGGDNYVAAVSLLELV